jgi:hypothetical protein
MIITLYIWAALTTAFCINAIDLREKMSLAKIVFFGAIWPLLIPLCFIRMIFHISSYPNIWK